MRHWDEFYEKLSEAELENTPSRSREYRCFRPYAGGERVGTKEYYINGMQDFKRAEDYNRGGWCFMVAHAEAQIITGTPGGGLINVIKSGHLGGIESDGDQSYFTETKQEQLAELRDALLPLGFTDRQIRKAFEKVVEVTR